jgi:hypothetical protein
MKKVKQWSVEKKDEIEKILIDKWASFGMDIPANFENIVQYVYEDVCETADPVNWSDSDVAIAFRRWVEEQNVPKKNDTRPNYFKINKQGWDEGLQREEVQVYCGENGNLMIIKTDEGYIVDAYDVKGEPINTMTIWEDDINPLVDDEEESDAPENFSDVEVEEFKKNWGQSQSEITANLDYPKSHSQSDELLVDDYFWIEEDKRWYPKCASLYTDREQAIADYLKVL